MTDDHMAGSEKRILPEQLVGAAMRQARGLSGVSLRQMAKRLGYHSHTTLSSYERGAVMPTDDVVRGYEQLLGLESGSLARILEDARIERHGDAWAKRRARLPTDFYQSDTTAHREPGPQRHGDGRRRWRWIMLGVAVVLMASGVALGLTLTLTPSPHPLPVPAALDGYDPKVTGCAIGASTAARVDVYIPRRYFAGVLELRTSSRCGTSWGRFIPALTLPRTPPLMIEIDVYRPADRAAAKFRIAFDGRDVYGNMLVSRYECAYAKVTLIRQGQPAPPPVETKCLLSR